MGKITRALHLDPEPPEDQPQGSPLMPGMSLTCRQDDPQPLQGPGLSRLSSILEASGSKGPPY